MKSPRDIGRRLGFTPTYWYDLRNWRHDIGKDGCYVHVLRGPRMLLRDILCKFKGHHRHTGGWKWRLCHRCGRYVVPPGTPESEAGK